MRAWRLDLSACLVVASVTACGRVATTPTPATTESAHAEDAGAPIIDPPPRPQICGRSYSLPRVGPRPVDMTLVVEASPSLDDARPAPSRHWSAVAAGIRDFVHATESADTLSLVVVGDARDPRTTYPSTTDVTRAALDATQLAAIDARLATTPAVDVPLHEVLEPVVNKTMGEPASAPNARKLFAYIAARNASETVDANAVFRADKKLTSETFSPISLDTATDTTPWVFQKASAYGHWCLPSPGVSCITPSTPLTDAELQSAIGTGLERAAWHVRAACRFTAPAELEGRALMVLDDAGEAFAFSDGVWATYDGAWSVELAPAACAAVRGSAATGVSPCPETP